MSEQQTPSADEIAEWLADDKRWEVRARKSASMKAAAARPEEWARKSAAMKAVWARPEIRARRSAAIKAALARPEVKARHKTAMARPEVRARISAATKAAWAAWVQLNDDKAGDHQRSLTSRVPTDMSPAPGNHAGSNHKDIDNEQA
jgi:hypothetical protein